jgi:rhodanese-related sulfurtransferase
VSALDDDAPRSIDELLAKARAGLRRVTAREAFAELEAGALLVDTRTLEQRRAHGDVPGARRIGLNVLEWRMDPQSEWREDDVDDHDRRVIVLCQEGYSSSLAASRLQQLGLHRATDVIDGFEAWRAAGLPIEPCADA